MDKARAPHDVTKKYSAVRYPHSTRNNREPFQRKTSQQINLNEAQLISPTSMNKTDCREQQYWKCSNNNNRKFIKSLLHKKRERQRKSYQIDFVSTDGIDMTKYVDTNALFDLQQNDDKIVVETISDTDPNISLAFLKI